MAAPILSFENLGLVQGAGWLFRGLDIHVGERDRLALIGRNGAGKTTLLKAIMGLVPIETGAVLFDGRALAPYPTERRVALGLGYAPEGRRPFAGMTVRENLEVACRAGRDERDQRLHDAFALFPQLEAKSRVRAWQLSGGQSQMLSIARALMSKPRLLLLDEPSLGLAARAVSDLMARLERIAGQGTAVLLAEQNASVALEIADRATVLDAGRVALAGSAIELKGSEAMEATFLGG